MMKLDVRSLVAEEKQSLPFSYALQLSEDDGVSADGVDIGGMLLARTAQVVGEVVGVAGCLYVKAEVSVDYTTACARCLSDVSRTHTFSFERHIVPIGQFTGLGEEESDTYLPIVDGTVDMDEALNEALILSLPLRVLCREDCAGLCPRCGKNLNEGKCDCPVKETDPRMAPLQALLDRLKESEESAK